MSGDGNDPKKPIMDRIRDAETHDVPEEPRDPGDTHDPAAPRRRARDGSRGARHGGTAASGGGADCGASKDGGERIDPDVLAELAKEPQNDTGNARRLMAHFGEDILHVRNIGWHAWTGTHWETEGGDEMTRRCAQATAERIALEAFHLEPSRADRDLIESAGPLREKPKDTLDRDGKKLLSAAIKAQDRLDGRRQGRRKFAISCGNSGRIKAMITESVPHNTIPPEDLDADPLAVNVANGTLQFEKVEVPDDECPDPDTERMVARWRVRLKPHDRADRIAKLMPVAYREGVGCPLWLGALERFQPDEQVRRFLQQFYGYALTGLMGEQCFVFHYGLGANFKSTFMETLARVQGNYSQVLPPEALTGDMQRRGDQATPEYARLPGARLVRCAELPRGQGFRESMLKALTGGEPILVRHLHGRFFEMRPTFKAVGSGNDRPSIGGVDEGIWRRVRLIPWNVTIPLGERRPMEKVIAEFLGEGPGIVNWLIEGALDYLDNGLFVPPEIANATETYRADMDPVGEFLGSCVGPLEGHHVTARTMYEGYVAWCHANSVKPFQERGFSSIMEQHGMLKEKGRIRKYLDVQLVDVPADPARFDAMAPGGGS